MKRLLVMVPCLILSLSLSGCSSKSAEKSASNGSVAQTQVNPSNESIVAGETECNIAGDISSDGRYICAGRGVFYWILRSEDSSEVGPKSVSTSTTETQQAAQDLVKENTARQDECYLIRTTYGDNPEYARQLCTARFPNSLEWALSTNHEDEQMCYELRLFSSYDAINARVSCLARYPIRN